VKKPVAGPDLQVENVVVHAEGVAILVTVPE